MVRHLGTDVFIEVGFELVMRRHFVALAAFLVDADPPAFAIGKIILDPHRDDGANTSKRIGHDSPIHFFNEVAPASSV
jgi:hypothetical protein